MEKENDKTARHDDLDECKKEPRISGMSCKFLLPIYAIYLREEFMSEAKKLSEKVIQP